MAVLYFYYLFPVGNKVRRATDRNNNPAYHEGLIIVPIVLIANMFNGIVFNLSFWFKLRDKTYCGTIIATIGALVTIIGLFFLVPRIGYVGAALSHLACYTVMMRSEEHTSELQSP